MAVVAPVLDRARTEINRRWPSRDKGTDGWIGNKAHAATGSPESGGSDHNPNKRSIVDALDIDVDGIDVPLLIALLIMHPSTNYVIWNRRIWSRSRGFKSHEYTGSNPHTDHVHLSILQTVAAENSTVPWGIVGINSTPAPAEGSWAQRLAASLPVLEKSTLVRGSVSKLQAVLNASGARLATDGVFGTQTRATVVAFQKAMGLVADGVVGTKTWAAVLGSMPTTKTGSAHQLPVRQIQSLLNLSGASLLVSDGKFGTETAAAVRLFQVKFGLTSDGIVGPVTWTALLTR